MVKAKKVYTPGSKGPPKHVSPGRPRKRKEVRKGTERKFNYRTRYDTEDLELAVKACADKKMTTREAALHFKVPKSTLHDRQGWGSRMGLFPIRIQNSFVSDPEPTIIFFLYFLFQTFFFLSNWIRNK